MWNVNATNGSTDAALAKNDSDCWRQWRPWCRWWCHVGICVSSVPTAGDSLSSTSTSNVWFLSVSLSPISAAIMAAFYTMPASNNNNNNNDAFHSYYCDAIIVRKEQKDDNVIETDAHMAVKVLKLSNNAIDIISIPFFLLQYSRRITSTSSKK